MFERDIDDFKDLNELHVAANRILYEGLEHQPLTAFLDAALAVLMDLPQIRPHSRTAIYYRGDRASSMRLGAHRHVEFTQIEASVTLQEATSGHTTAEMRRAGRIFVPIEDASLGTLGLFVIFSNADASQGEILAATLEPVTSAIAAVLKARQTGPSGDQLSAVVEASPHEVLICDPVSLRILRANGVAQRNSGYRPGRFAAMTPADLKPELDEATYRLKIAPVLSGEADHATFEAIQKRRDGTTYSAVVRVWKLASDDSEVIVEQVVDQSDHNMLANLLSAAIDSFPGGFCALSPELRLTMANRNFYELLDLPEECFPIGTPFEEIVRFCAVRGEYGQGDVEELVRMRVEHARLFLNHNFEREGTNGKALDVRVAPLVGGGCVLTYSDITERRRAQVELMRHRDDLERAVAERTAEIERQSTELERALAHERRVNELQRQFVAMASHEFRTPLAIIDGAAQRLVRAHGELTQESVRDRVARIRGAVGRMVELMDSILAAERLEDGRIQISPSECCVAQILASCCERQYEVSRSHTIRHDCSGLPDFIIADPAAIEQVFTNLLSNAVKYSPASSHIDVLGWREEDYICISVRDEGVGIDEDELPKMFQRYFRARTSSGIAGTGIGLNLVRQILELHGGCIEVQSRKGAGSIFTVRLPVGDTTTGNISIENTRRTAQGA